MRLPNCHGNPFVDGLSVRSSVRAWCLACIKVETVQQGEAEEFLLGHGFCCWLYDGCMILY